MSVTGSEEQLVGAGQETVAAPDTPAVGQEQEAGQPRRRSRLVWFVRRPGLVLSVLVILLVLAWAFWPSLFTSRNPDVGNPADNLLPPSARNWFGTDYLGRDLYTRVVYGAQYSLREVALAVALAFVCGAVLGVVSGYVGGLLDNVLMRIVDVLLSVPSLLVSLVLITAIGFGSINVSIAVGAAAVATFARVTRSEVIRVRGAAYVESAVMDGHRWWTVLWRHVFPNSYGPLMALAALEFGGAILAVAGLSFLGFGAAPPAPEWGSLVADGRNYLATSWWMTTLPGVVVIVVVVSANRIARALDGEWRSAR
jgi:peptide/nickel transport system permease protein